MPFVNLITESLESKLSSYHRIDRKLLDECLIGVPAYTNCLISGINPDTMECEVAFFVPQGEPFDKKSLGELYNRKYFLELIFFESFVQDIPVFGLGGVLPIRINSTNQISPFCSLVSKEVTNSFLFKDYIVSNTLEKASLFILRELHDSYYNQYSEINEHFDNERLMRILNFLHLHIEEDITLERLGELVYLSADYISQFFKRCIGTSIQSYLIDQRVKRGLEYLVTTRWPISVIAERSGFIDQAYFNRRFKLNFKVNPLRLRKKYQLLTISQAGEGMALAR